MIITRTSQYSGIVRSIDLPVTQAQMDAYNRGELIQRAFPNLSRSACEFIQTGITDEEWNELFPPEDQ